MRENGTQDCGKTALSVAGKQCKVRHCYARMEHRKTVLLLKSSIMRQVVVYPGEDNYWVVECPSLSGCISQGKNRGEALENIKEAIQAYIAALEEDNLAIPEDHFDAMLVAL